MNLVETLKRQGFKSVEGADVGTTSHLLMRRDSDGECVLLHARRGRGGDGVWLPVWRGPESQRADAWEEHVERPLALQVAAEADARRAPRGRGVQHAN
jgi:hypothetical protein